ncbi:MAG TPA: glycosyltransferase [Candidatus Methylomirabilis sp.]|nr:glycosyltransferase [Candidatus Methylomirabilis sp.]
MSAAPRGVRAGASPRVSVMIPAHNRAGVLGRAIRSVLAQPVADLELIVVDDGSTDGTAEVATALADPRLRLVRLPGQRGVAAARNAAIAAAAGTTLAFLDSDDEWAPEKLERQLACLEALPGRDRAVVTSRYTRYNDLTGRLAPPERPMPAGEPFGCIVAGSAPLPSTAVLPRSTLEAAGPFDEDLPALADYEFWLRLADASTRFVELREPLVVKHEHGTRQISSDPDLLLTAFVRLDRKWGARIQERCGNAAYRRWRSRLLASIQYVRVRQSVARGDRLAAWRHCAVLGSHAGRSPAYVVYGIGLATLGLRAYDALARLKDAARRGSRAT